MPTITRLAMLLLISGFMFEIGLQLTSDVLREARRAESAVLRGLGLMLVLSPLLALLVVRLFSLDAAVATPIVILSITGVLPLASRGRTTTGYLPSAVLLALIAGALAILAAPLSARFLLAYVGDSALPKTRLIAQLVLLQGVPIALGVLLQSVTDRAPLVARVTGVLNKVLLGVTAALVILPNLSVFGEIGWNGLAATVLFSVALWLLAHAIGGPGQEDRRTLALLANAPNVALALAMTRSAHAGRAGTVLLFGIFLVRMGVGGALRLAAARRERASRPALASS